MYTKHRILYLRGCRVLWDCGGHRLLLILLLPFGVGAIIIFIILLPLCPRSGELRTQKLKSRLVRTRTELKHSPFKAWSRSVYSHTCYGSLLIFYPSGPFTAFFPNPLPIFSFLCRPAEENRSLLDAGSRVECPRNINRQKKKKKD